MTCVKPRYADRVPSCNLRPMPHWLRILGWFWWLPCWVQAQTLPGVLECYSTSRGGGVYRLVAKGDFLYAGEGSSLVVYDTRTPSYQRVYEKRFCSPITDLRIHSGQLYVTANHDGLSRWDISIPIKPGLTGEYRPADFSAAFHGLRFSRDTLFIAAASGVWMLRELTAIGPAFEKFGQFAEQAEGKGRVVGGEVLGNRYLAAIMGKEKGIGQGIHAYQIVPEARLNFQHYDASEVEELMYLPGTQRLLAFGGSSRAGDSHLLCLDVEHPMHPKLCWADTVLRKGSLATAGAGIVQGDTLLVPIMGHLRGGCGDAAGAVAVYSLRDTREPHYLGQVALPAAPYHLALVGRRLHVAFGDRSIVTYDFGKWQAGDCRTLPEIGWSPRSGGFCLGADAQGDKLLTANGDAGAILHLIQDRKTIALRTFERLGRVEQVRFLGDGSIAACWVARGGADSIVVVQVADGKPIGGLGGGYGHRWVVGSRDRFVCARDDKSGFDILDFRNPQKPKKEQTVLLNFNDLSLDEAGRLLVSTDHNVRLFDIGSGGFSELASFARWGDGFGAVASDGDALYACTVKRGLIRFRLVKDSRGYSLKEELVWKLPHKQPQRMVIDQHGIYLAYNDYGIYALDKQRFETMGYYRTGLEYRNHSEEGLQDIFCKDGKVFVVEYYGQVTVLKRTDVE